MAGSPKLTGLGPHSAGPHRMQTRHSVLRNYPISAHLRFLSGNHAAGDPAVFLRGGDKNGAPFPSGRSPRSHSTRSSRSSESAWYGAYSKHERGATNAVLPSDICSNESRGGTLLCRKRSAPRRESVGVKLHLCWESPEYLWRWRVAEHPHRRSDRWPICRRTIRRHVWSSRSVRKKSPTSACRRSLSSTK